MDFIFKVYRIMLFHFFVSGMGKCAFDRLHFVKWNCFL